VICWSAEAYTTGWDSRKELVGLEDRYLVCLVCLVEPDQLDELNAPNEPEKQERRGQLLKEVRNARKNGMLELRRYDGVGYDNDSVHDGMDSAEIGIATGNQSWNRETTVR